MDDIEILARTLWGEARGDGETGMRAVGCVIMNRVKNPSWWGNDVESVCLQPKQFTCWNKGDPNREKLLAVTVTDSTFALAMKIAEEILAGARDVTDGADHYFNPKIVTPKWYDPERVTKVIGNHTFLRLAIPVPQPPAPLLETNTAKATGAVAAAGAVGIAVQAVPVFEALGKMTPVVAITIVVVTAAAVLLWRWKKDR
jgi:hypothetical protein